MTEPYCLAMVLCDLLHRDTLSGKYTILGTFSTVHSPVYPCQVRFCVYFALTDGQGEFDIKLRVVESGAAFSDNPEELGGFVAKTHFEEPLTVHEYGAVVVARLPKPAVYHCELYCDDTLLMSRRLLATLPVPPAPNEEAHG